MAHKKPVRLDPLTAALPPGGIDSHAHIDGSEYDQDRNIVIERARNVGVSGIGNVFMSPALWLEKKHLFDNYKDVFFLLGIHPCDGLSCTPQCLEEIENAFYQDKRLKAVGEIGLDFHWNDCPKELQLQAFAKQVELAKKINKPIVIHCRDAASECITFLEAAGFDGYPLLWHCFGGDSFLAKRIINNGWHVSIPGTVTYPANTNFIKALEQIPDNRLLLETDCPYLSPIPWRGTRNEPAYIVFTAHAVAKLRDIQVDKLWEMCGSNAKRFFGIDQI